MGATDRSDRILASGPCGTVEYAVRLDGAQEARVWLESQPMNKQASFGVLFRRLVMEGRIHNTRQFRRLRDRVWEFKRGGDRLLCIQYKRQYLLTHRIPKAGGRGKCPPQEIDHAERIGNEHLGRER